MKFDELLHIVGHAPVFTSSLLLAGEVNPRELARQLSRWQKAGRIVQLRRGLYALAPPLQKVKPHPFLIANQMEPGSYISCQSVLSYSGLIPEFVPVTISVGRVRPSRRVTDWGVFEFHHIKSEMAFGYRKADLPDGQDVFMAMPEKALLDLIYLTSEADTHAFIRELRLNLDDTLDPSMLMRFAERSHSQKLLRAAGMVVELITEEKNSYSEL